MRRQNILEQRTKRQFIDPEKITLTLRCSICYDIFEDPVRTACGHTFCFICIQGWIRVDKSCPLCKRSTTDRKLEVDLIAYNIVNDLPAKCIYEKCKWKGITRSAKKHQRFCSYRPKEVVSLVEPNEALQAADNEPEDIHLVYLDESQSWSDEVLQEDEEDEE